MEQGTKDFGKMICNMEWVRRLGLMGLYTREITLEGRNMDLGSIVGMMGLLMRGIGMRIRLKELALING
jgi:hypothetical protein